MASVAFQARLRRVLLARGLVTRQTTRVHHIFEDIVGRVTHGSLPQINLGVQGETQGGLHNHSALKADFSKRLNGRWFLISESASRLRMFSLDTIGCLKSGKWRRTDSREVIGEYVDIVIIA
ncbi:hypothetical protein TNCV_3218891 [Trichonephila clavipes]|nr:hypothetical protein TNCV_3218891 [Trichonephila clavipes]